MLYLYNIGIASTARIYNDFAPRIHRLSRQNMHIKQSEIGGPLFAAMSKKQYSVEFYDNFGIPK
jgi:hypothetical protein